MTKALILDDDVTFSKSLSTLALGEGIEVAPAGTIAEAKHLLGEARYDLILLDLELPDGCGLDLLHQIDHTHHGRIVVVTGQPSLETALRAIGDPVVEYLVKPIPLDQWTRLFRDIQYANSIADDLQLMRTRLLGRSHAIREIVATLLRLAPGEMSIMLIGESGTGKSLAAQALHDASGRAGPFVTINCGAISNEQIAGDLFGNLTSGLGGSDSPAGLFQRAMGGTLFLDEIADMPLPLQAHLLQAIDDAHQKAFGSDMSAPRIIAATRSNPSQAISDGRIRENLYYRLTDFIVEMPPLRQREEDVLLLARVFVDRLNARHGKRKRLSRSAERSLLHHLWPGNVRELRSAVQRGYLLFDDSDIISYLPVFGRHEIHEETDKTVVFNIGMTMLDVERRLLLKTLAHFGNDKTATARSLGISVRTVHNYLSRMAEEHQGRRQRPAAANGARHDRIAGSEA